MSANLAFPPTSPVEPESQTLVRRFTDQLTGVSSLERATKSAQEDSDERSRRNDAARLQALYRDTDGDSFAVNFHETETARLALVEALKALELVEKPSSTLARFGIQRKSVRATATETMHSVGILNFADLSNYIDAQEKRWQAGQGNVSKRFRILCNYFDAHRQVFSIFPAQSNYASVVCGSLSAIVRAAANHDEIAETISETIEDITQRAQRAAKILLVVKTRDVRELFSKLYAQVLLFYRDAIEWYGKTKAARFRGSFNEKLKEQYEKSGHKIERILNEMYRELSIAQLARLTNFHETKQESEDEWQRLREGSASRVAFIYSGQRMQALLMSMDQAASYQEVTDEPLSKQAVRLSGTNADRTGEDLMTRAQVRSLIPQLKSLTLTGNNAVISRDSCWFPDAMVVHRLHVWFAQSDRQTLWVASPDPSADVTNAHAAAISAILTAREAELPTIFHLCRRPRYTEVDEARDIEKVGSLGLLYSLILQLLQFDVDSDRFVTPRSTVNNLDGGDASWSSALQLLSTLLENTPSLSLCVIDGLNDLANAGGIDWCRQFLSILFTHQKSSGSLFRVLITTSGACRVLQESIDVHDCELATGKPRNIGMVGSLGRA